MEKILKIGLFSFVIDYKNPMLINNIFKDILNIINSNDDLDIIVFSGFTLFDTEKLKELEKSITNKNSVIFLEVWNDKHGQQSIPKGYFFSGGKLHDKNIIQLFATSTQINGNITLMSEFLEHLESNRIIQHKGINLCWIICGELNVLENIQSEDNRVVFRLASNSKLRAQFNKIYSECNIFINPTHSQMGNQGKISKRRQYLSANKKLYCSVSNFDLMTYKKKYGVTDVDTKQKLKTQKSLQYCVYDGHDVSGEIVALTNDYVFKKFIINAVF